MIISGDYAWSRMLKFVLSPVIMETKCIVFKFLSISVPYLLENLEKYLNRFEILEKTSTHICSRYVLKHILSGHFFLCVYFYIAMYAYVCKFIYMHTIMDIYIFRNIYTYITLYRYAFLCVHRHLVLDVNVRIVCCGKSCVCTFVHSIII